MIAGDKNILAATVAVFNQINSDPQARLILTKNIGAYLSSVAVHPLEALEQMLAAFEAKKEKGVTKKDRDFAGRVLRIAIEINPLLEAGMRREFPDWDWK